jgi:lysyl-tRNA synthetase, class II
VSDADAPQTESAEELSQLLRARRDKLAALQARGVEPFAYSFDRTHTTTEAAAAFSALEAERGADDAAEVEGPTARVAGRLTS